MPINMNGRELAEKLRTERPGVKGHFYQWLQRRHRRQGLQAGAGVEFFCKTLPTTNPRADGAPLPGRQTGLNRRAGCSMTPYSNFSLTGFYTLKFSA